MSTTEFDYLIVGQGLAGTILAHTLITRGLTVMLIDNTHTGSSSVVAAGIINSVTGPRLKNDDDFELYYSAAKSYYAKLEYHIKETVFNPINQIRKIQTDDQSSFLRKRLDDPKYHKFVQIDDSVNSHFKSKKHTHIKILNTAIVDTKKLLKASKKWLSGIDSYNETNLDYSKLVFSNNQVIYDSFVASNIIFCEGFQAINNPWLAHLPFKLAKGEILTLDINDTQLDNTMLSWGKWLVPFSNTTDNNTAKNNIANSRTAKLGSSFSWDNIKLTADANIKKMLLQSLAENTNISANVLAHDVGIRPSTVQRNPFIGPLPKQKNAYCFNGFGSKGCLLIPYYAELLAKHLLHDNPLPKKVTQCL